MFTNRIGVGLLVLFSLVLYSCSFKASTYSLVSTKEIDLKRFPSLQKSKDKVIGEDKFSLIIFIPTRFTKESVAVDNAINKIPGCIALADVEIYEKVWYIPYIYGEGKYVVEGTALIDTKLKKDGQAFRGKMELDRNGNLKSFDSISKEDYLAEKNKMIKKRHYRKMADNFVGPVR